MSGRSAQYTCASCARYLKNGARRLPEPMARFNIKRFYSLGPTVTDRRSFRLAVIGSGPAGFYTAYKIMSKIPDAKIDMFEQLPVPFGLVRFGVAPDHPEVKNCQDMFREVAEHPNFSFIGNVAIGTGIASIPLNLLIPHYDAILFSYGASKDRTLGIEGEATVKGIYSARAFVGWYNGLPEYAGLNPDLSKGEEAVIVGQGNVALDVARILLGDIDALRKTDITENALEALSKSRIKDVRVIGRRGPMQAAFTIKEIRELLNVPGLSFRSVERILVPSDIAKLPRVQRRLMEVLVKGSKTSQDRARKAWSLDFRLSPSSFNATDDQELASVSFEKTSLSPDNYDISARAQGTGDVIDLQAALAFRSIGYKSEALPGLEDIGVPFDDRLGIIPNDQCGRVMRPAETPNDPLTSRHVPGMYCAGWVKRGPTGVIASTMNDAFATADAIAQDWHSNVPFGGDHNTHRGGWETLRHLAYKRGCRPVSWQDWLQIDRSELERGRAKGKEREKFTSIKDMLGVLD